jgi:hypothetical protein
VGQGGPGSEHQSGMNIVTSGNGKFITTMDQLVAPYEAPSEVAITESRDVRVTRKTGGVLRR